MPQVMPSRLGSSPMRARYAGILYKGFFCLKPQYSHSYNSSTTARLGWCFTLSVFIWQCALSRIIFLVVLFCTDRARGDEIEQMALQVNAACYSGFRKKARVIKCKSFWSPKPGGMVSKRSLRRPRKLGMRVIILRNNTFAKCCIL